MFAPLRIRLDEPEQQELAAQFEQTRDAETRLRYQMVCWLRREHYPAECPASVDWTDSGQAATWTLR